MKKLGQIIFLTVVLGNLSLNHTLLGFCHCHEAIFVAHCSCDEIETCPCEECPVEPAHGSCSSYLYLDLDEFSQTVEVKAPPVEEVSPVALAADFFQNPDTSFDEDESVPWCQATGPPGRTVPLRQLYSVFLI